MKIAVLIPCYNEVTTIAKVVTDFRTALPEKGMSFVACSAKWRPTAT